MSDAVDGSGGRVVVVTGAARHIGAGIARRFADEGALVVATDIIEPEIPDPRIRFAHLDVSSAEEVETFFAGVIEEYGRVDVLVNNAGIWAFKPMSEISVEEWDRVMGVNLRGAFLCIRSVIDTMTEHGGGSIINIGSQAGMSVTRGQGVHYASSKAAIAHLTKVLGVELGPAGIRVNCVAPGSTPPPERIVSAEAMEAIPIGRTGTPYDIAAACAFMASDQEAGYVNGQTLLVNGGSIAFL